MFSHDQARLRQELKDLLATLGFPLTDPVGADLQMLLQAPGKLLASDLAVTRVPAGFWALFPLLLVRYCVPTAAGLLVSRVAFACEFLHCALDTFDDLEDDDRSELRTTLGDGRFLNAATLLMTLAPLLFEELVPNYLSLEVVHHLQHLIRTRLVTAMQGQHHDLLAEDADLATFEPARCLQIAAAKSATLFQLVCQISLDAVQAPAELTQLFVQVSHYMGIVAQLENDAHDLEVELTLQESDPQSFQKSDFRRHKKTLPIVLAHRQLIALQKNTLKADTDKQREQASTLQRAAFEQALVATFGTIEYLRKSANLLVVRIVDLSGKDLPTELHILLNLDPIS